MDEFTIAFDPSASSGELQAITQGVLDAHREHMGDWRQESLPVVLRDADGTLRGGAIGRAVYGDLHVDSIWVTPELRRNGVGRRIPGGDNTGVRGASMARWERIVSRSGHVGSDASSPSAAAARAARRMEVAIILAARPQQQRHRERRRRHRDVWPSHPTPQPAPRGQRPQAWRRTRGCASCGVCRQCVAAAAPPAADFVSGIPTRFYTGGCRGDATVHDLLSAHMMGVPEIRAFLEGGPAR